MRQDRVSLAALGLLFVVAAAWIVLVLLSDESSSGVDVFGAAESQSEGEGGARRMREVPVSVASPEVVEVQRQHHRIVVRDQLTKEALKGVIIKSSSGQLGPTGDDGVVSIPVDRIGEDWAAELSEEFGRRECRVEMPFGKGGGESAELFVPAICRARVNVSTSDGANPKDVSLVFAPQALWSLPNDGDQPRPGMAKMMSMSPLLTRQWLVRKGLDRGRAGKLTSSGDGVVVVDANYPGVFNVLASSKRESGSVAVELFAGEEVSVSLALKPTGRVVSGIVVNESGMPLPGADVRFACAREFGPGEILPVRDPNAGQIVRGSKYHDRVVVSHVKSVKADAEGRFEWRFNVSDSILVWAFYRDPAESFSGCGYFASQEGDPRVADELVVVVSNEIPFGSSVRLIGEAALGSRGRGFVLRDDNMYRPEQFNDIPPPVVLRGDRLIIDMLPAGASCELITGAGIAKFRAVPGAEVSVD